MDGQAHKSKKNLHRTFLTLDHPNQLTTTCAEVPLSLHNFTYIYLCPNTLYCVSQGFAVFLFKVYRVTVYLLATEFWVFAYKCCLSLQTDSVLFFNVNVVLRNLCTTTLFFSCHPCGCFDTEPD